MTGRARLRPFRLIYGRFRREPASFFELCAFEKGQMLKCRARVQRAATWRGFCRALAIVTKEAADALSVATQEATDKDSMSSYTYCST